MHVGIGALFIGLLAAVPSSTNFVLEQHDFGAGSGSSASSNYNLQSSNGSLGGDLSSSSYALPAGVRATSDVAVPPAPTFVNPDASYNRLKLTLNVSGMPSDAKYLIAISDDNFVTTKYVQTDQTVGLTAGIANYQTYAAWGGASGFWILGLDYDTTYKVKVAALQGAASGSAFGPTATAATVEPSVTFAVTTSLASSPPFATSFSSLTPGVVTSGSATIIANVTTNAMFGGSMLLKSQNGGLTSVVASNTLASATADLTAANNGYGVQIASTAQGSGGPMVALSPFNGSSGDVGGLTTSWQQLSSFATAVTGGNVTFAVKAKADAALPSAIDYSDVLTLNISLLF